MKFNIQFQNFGQEMKLWYQEEEEKHKQKVDSEENENFHLYFSELHFR